MSETRGEKYYITTWLSRFSQKNTYKKRIIDLNPVDNGIYDFSSGSSLFLPTFFSHFSNIFVCLCFFLTLVYICQNLTYNDLFWHYEIFVSGVQLGL